MIRALWPIFWGVLLTLITAWSLGRALVRGLGVKLARLEEDLIALLSGSACLSAVVFVLSSVHMARRGVFTILCLASIGFLYRKKWLRPTREGLPRPPGAWQWLFLAPFAVYTFVYFFNALAPQTNPGATGYHLGNVMRWWSESGFDGGFDPHGSAFANLPQGLEMLFLFAFPFGKYSAAVLVHFVFLMALPWLLLSYGRRFGMVRPAILGAILVYASPAVGVLGTSAANDLALACVLFGLFYVLELWDMTGGHRLLALAGLLAGFAYAINYAGALAVFASIAFVVCRLALQRKPVGRAVITLISTAAISILPWMVKNWMWVSNPFAPFLNSWFPNPNFHVSSEASYGATLGLSSALQGWKTIPLRWSLGGTSVEGVFGPWLLLTPLALLAARCRHGRRLLLAAALFGVPALAGKAFALVLPFAIFAAPALGLAVQNTPGVLPLLLILHSIVSWPNVVEGYAARDVWRIQGLRIAKALRSTPEDMQLLNAVEGYGVARAIERSVPRNANVLTLSPVPQAYTARRLWDHTESAAGELAYEAMLAAYHPWERHMKELHFRFAPQTILAVRAVQTPRVNAAWSVTEMRLYLGGREVERRNSWRVSARPNAWEALRAFDHSEVTAWSTWQAIEPGMYLEEQFDAPVVVDEVVLVGPQDARTEKLRIDGSSLGLSNDGQWRTLAGQPVIMAHDWPSGLGRAAMEELKSAGFGYIVAKAGSALDSDLIRDPSYWGVTLVVAEEAGKFCVFRVQ